MLPDELEPCSNGAVHIVVLTTKTEAELGGLYINSREAIPMRHILNKMGHKQPPTLLQTDNSTALGVVKARSNQKAQKPWTCNSTGYVSRPMSQHVKIHILHIFHMSSAYSKPPKDMSFNANPKSVANLSQT